MTTELDMLSMVSEAMRNLFFSRSSEILDIVPFDDYRVLTTMSGLVITTEDGSEFQVAVAQTK